jgi:hypothetical protein
MTNPDNQSIPRIKNSVKCLVRSGIVLRTEDYIISCTSNFIDENGILDAEVIQNSIVKFSCYDE